MKVIVVGGGAAGFFSAIQFKIHHPDADVILVEKSSQVLAKVKISGGGRCNVTHACFDPKQMADHYPRGGKALIGPFQSFQAQDTMDWFEACGVALKIEADNRVFPVSNASQSIVDCLLDQARQHQVRVWVDCGVTTIVKTASGQFSVTLTNGQVHIADRVILTTGSSRAGYALAESLGHSIVPPIPSLFTIKINDPELLGLAGVSVADVGLKVTGAKSNAQRGPLLVTHWGFSGPAMIKLSAWAAREFYEANYELLLHVSWLPTESVDDIIRRLEVYQKSSKKTCANDCPFPALPGRLWGYLVQKWLKNPEKRWQEVSKKESLRMTELLKSEPYISAGKGVFKEEFVTCGGVSLKEVNFKTMESRVCPGLYFAGEILDVDGVTGGFNFQNAWTTGFLAGKGS